GGSFTYSAAGDGSYSFYTVAVDKAGNRENPPATADTTTLLDTVAATSNAVAPQDSASTTITVDYAGSDPGTSPSGLGGVQLWAKAPNELGYSEVASYTAPLANGSFSYAALAGDGTYSFYTVAVDTAGHAERAPAPA